MPTYAGRLELTWTNKHLRLLAHDDGSYEWVPASDYRVAEVRLLHNAGVVGQVTPERDRAKDNLLIRGDALNALTSLIELPEFAREYVGKVKLVYLDPPFNTQQSFLQYDDALEHSVWLTMMRDRLNQVKTLLSVEGSVWVHCDDSEQHRLRCVLDETFGPENFVATIIWEKADSPRNSARQFSTDQDYIVVYSKSPEWVPQRLARTEEANAIYTNPDDDPLGPWLPGDPFANKPYSRGLYEVTGPTGRVFSPPPGRFWRVSKEKFEDLNADNRIWWGPKGDARPSIKRYLSEVADLVPRTLWLRDDVGSNRTSKNEMRHLFPGAPSFATPKPEALMRRIIDIATSPGDTVIDCFLGSGTTAAVAQKMGRRWIGIEILDEVIDTYVVPRLTKVIDGEDGGGITAAVGWQGGGGFCLLAVAPSMFEADGGQVFLSGWATNGRLAEATAAQVHYDYESDPPFCGRRGHSRLAVIDGLVNEAVVRVLVKALAESERLLVCGTAIDPAARDAARTLRPGSSVRKIPQSILQEYRQGTLWVQQSLPLITPGESEASTPAEVTV